MPDFNEQWDVKTSGNFGGEDHRDLQLLEALQVEYFYVAGGRVGIDFLNKGQTLYVCFELNSGVDVRLVLYDECLCGVCVVLYLVELEVRGEDVDGEVANLG